MRLKLDSDHLQLHPQLLLVQQHSQETLALTIFQLWVANHRPRSKVSQRQIAQIHIHQV